MEGRTDLTASAILTGRWGNLPARSGCRLGTRKEGGEMTVTRATLEQLAVPLNRRGYPAFVEAVERLPAADRHVLAVLGAGQLPRPRPSSRDYLRRPGSLLGWLSELQRENIDET